MSANVKAEAILIVIKRILKRTGFVLLGGVVLIVIFSSYDEFQRYQRDKPRLVTEYAGVSLGESTEHVKYAIGNPSQIEHKGEGDSTKDQNAGRGPVLKVDGTNGHLISTSKEWMYSIGQNLITVEFDKPGGGVVSVSCFSFMSYVCPEIFGIRDGTDEKYVLDRLGKPDSEVLEDARKVLRYNRYNLTLYLAMKKVYMLEVTASSGTIYGGNAN